MIASGVEAVALETPPYFFPEHVQAAVDARLHVYMAKPIAVDVPGCLQVQAAAKKATENKQCFLVDYQMPTDPFNIEVRKRLREGGLGKLQMVFSVGMGGGSGFGFRFTMAASRALAASHWPRSWKPSAKRGSLICGGCLLDAWRASWAGPPRPPSLGSPPPARSCCADKAGTSTRRDSLAPLPSVS